MKTSKLLTILLLGGVFALFTACQKGNGNNEDSNKFNAANNHYTITNKSTGEKLERTFSPEYGTWEQRTSSFLPSANVVTLSLEEADKDGGTIGGGYLELPEELAEKPITLDKEKMKKYASLHLDLFCIPDTTAGYSENNYLSVHIKPNMESGELETNIKLDGKSTFKVEKIASKANDYEGNYLFSFNLDFTYANVEYNIDGCAEVSKYYPPVRTFTLSPHRFYLGYGGAGQVLEVEYEPANAKWDWNDLEIATNADQFNWYPATHTISINTLGPYADAHTLNVQVKFQLKSDPSVYDYVYVDKNEEPRN